ncbi:MULTISPECIES: SDR family oxidoreductase [unclassified Pseudomonas]|uniref:UDP-glucose 4-epimerase family protein n=1 Tax=unclassified Pseudomonas TaxID=196821 RepID=UPI001F55B281|nr:MULTISPECIES: SDR family oxidoreductase [unclassified Pseudomonas]
MNLPQVLVTGASGFVGEALVFRLLVDREYTPIAVLRKPTRLCGLCRIQTLDLGDPKSLPVLVNVEVVIHAAARVHVMNETADNALAEFRKINVDGTLRLARLAAESGVKRFIFVSSIKVNGETTVSGRPFRADDPSSPCDPYGVSKYEAEEALKALGYKTGMEIVIIRPPLVYGRGVKANFLSMLNLIYKGMPLPLGGIRNQRSLVAIENLLSLIITCIDHPAASNQTFLVSDGDDVSTPQLLRRLARALDRPARLLPIPGWMLEWGGSVLGRRGVVARVCGSLQVDIEKNSELLDWKPIFSMEKALHQTADYYLEERAK